MSCAHFKASSDVTVCDPLRKALIQRQYGCKLEDTPKPLLRHLVAQFRARGNAAFREGQYAGARTYKECSKEGGLVSQLSPAVSGNTPTLLNSFAEAVKCYSQAIAGAEHDHTLFANRSASYLAQHLFHDAIKDAEKTVWLKEAWPKGHYRCRSNKLLSLSLQDEHAYLPVYAYIMHVACMHYAHIMHSACTDHAYTPTTFS